MSAESDVIEKSPSLEDAKKRLEQALERLEKLVPVGSPHNNTDQALQEENDNLRQELKTLKEQTKHTAEKWRGELSTLQQLIKSKEE